MTNTIEDIQWDFSKAYPEIDDPIIRNQLKEAKERAQDLQNNYKGKIDSNLSSQTVKNIIVEIEEIYSITWPIDMYSELLLTKDSQNDEYKRFQSEIQEKTTEIHNELAFFVLELNKLEDIAFNKYLQGEELTNYHHYLQNLRKKKPYQLSEEEEQMIVLKDQYGRHGFQKLYQELVSSWTYQIMIDGEMKTLTGSEMGALRRHPDKEIRRNAMKILLNKFKENELILVNIFNNLTKDYFIENRKRGYPSPLTKRNLANEIDNEIVGVLEKATTAYYHSVHRYYKLKKKILGLEQFTTADISAPLPEVVKEYSWDDGIDIVLKAFDEFNTEFADIAKQMVNEKRIDALPKPGKEGGAFCASSSPKEWPWILMNF
ncbi:MAG: hypothetical protein ACXAD7_12175, partial [Candidatus Kariarchaeaceae archaeon]